jgi:hypothetical protein
MKIKSLALVIVIMHFALQVEGQISSLFSEDNKLFESLKSTIYVVKVEYTLEDSEGNTYNKEGISYFNSIYSVGVNVNGSIVFEKSVLKVMYQDSSVTNDFSPNISAIKYWDILEKKVHKMDRDGLIELPTYYLLKTDSLGAGLKEKSIQTEEKSLVVLFIADDNSITDSTDFDLNYIYSTINWSGNEGIINESNLGNDFRFGLIFYEQVGIGSVHGILSGFLKNDISGWKAVPYQRVVVEVDKKKKRKK